MTVASGTGSHAEGRYALASGISSHAEGMITVASGVYSHAEGQGVARGFASHAEGGMVDLFYEKINITNLTSISLDGNVLTVISTGQGASDTIVIVTGDASGLFATLPFTLTSFEITDISQTYIPVDINTTFTAPVITTVNWDSNTDTTEIRFTPKLNDFYYRIESTQTLASGSYSHAEGAGTQTIGVYSHAEGLGTIALGKYQSVTGQYNQTSSYQSAFIIGNGTSYYERTNLLYASGSEVQITGSLTVSGSSTFTNIGPAVFSGSVISTQGFTGSFSGSVFGYVRNEATTSFVTNSQTSSFVTNSQTGSFILNSQTSSMTVLSSSFATTASYIDPIFISASAVASGFGSGGGGGLTYQQIQRLIALGS
jgi:hypothetical protein